MNAKEAIEKIKVALGFEVTPEVEVELKKADKVESFETPAESKEVVTTEVPEAVAPNPGQSEAETLARIKEADAKAKKDREDLEKEFKHMGIKMAEQTEEITTIKSAMTDLLKVVEFLSQEPTADPTEKPNGMKSFLADRKQENFLRIQEGFKQVNEKLKTN